MAKRRNKQDHKDAFRFVHGIREALPVVCFLCSLVTAAAKTQQAQLLYDKHTTSIFLIASIVLPCFCCTHVAKGFAVGSWRATGP